MVVSARSGQGAVEPIPRRPGRRSLGITVSAAVSLILQGALDRALAQTADSGSSSLQEVVVTATRREQSASEVPYSLSVVSAESLTKANVTDIASLSNQVPGLSIYDYGARFSGATTPIIRGLNATAEPRGFRTFEQDPVGTYIGNSPISGYFQLEDLERVEVLRGPQGTLYGAGALGGALRFIPKAPELGTLSGEVSAGADRLAHSDGTGYTVAALANVPIGDTLALRASGKYQYEPGFIDTFGLMKRNGSITTGAPVLADPSKPVDSPAVYTNRSDWNYQKTFTGRASLLWKPVSAFSLELAFLRSHTQGDGGPQVNPTFAGGPYPIDPRITAPAGGPYQEYSQSDQPFSRATDLASADVSYDAGFATISSTSSYYTTRGTTIGDDTYTFASFPYIAYYAGSPRNPRYVDVLDFGDQAHTFSEELRLVSNSGPDRVIDYTVGLYYERQERNGSWNVTDPGSYERSVAQGCTAPYDGTGYPDCLLVVGPQDSVFTQVDTQRFEDKSIFGELTWHFTHRGQVTFGGRHFQQQFTDAQSYVDYPFETVIPAIPHSAPASKNTWKVNPSYEYADHQYVYATWSQGFRRGGANSVPLVGQLRESPELASYAPDSVNNYELGLKARLDNGTTYTLAVFDIEWTNPQISASLPSGNLAVYNGKGARSRGFEAEANGPLVFHGLSYTLGLAYAHAELTRDFSLPANDGSGNIVNGLVTGTARQQLPGSPKVSTAATVNYDWRVMPGYNVNFSVNQTYRSHIPLGLSGETADLKSSAFGLWNLSASLIHADWRVLSYATNLLDKQAVLAPPARPNLFGNLTNDYIVNKPREVGVRVFYDF